MITITLNVNDEELAFIKQSVEINLSLIEIAHYANENNPKQNIYNDLLIKLNSLVEENK